MTASTISYEIADVSCMLCGRAAGRARRDGLGAQLFYSAPQAEQWRAVRSVSALRCANCGGSLTLDEFEERREFTPEALLEEDASRPRRGRPPRPFRIPSRAA